jgi:hypothetical protein
MAELLAILTFLAPERLSTSLVRRGDWVRED